MNETFLSYAVAGSIIFFVVAVVSVVVVIRRSGTRRSEKNPSRHNRRQPIQPPPVRIPTRTWPAPPVPRISPPEPPVTPLNDSLEERLLSEIESLRQNIGIDPKLYRKQDSSHYYVKIELPNDKDHSQYIMHVFFDGQDCQNTPDLIATKKYFNQYSEWVEHRMPCTFKEYNEGVETTFPPSLNILIRNFLNKPHNPQPDPMLDLPYDQIKLYTEQIYL